MASPENVSLEDNNFIPPADTGLKWSSPVDIFYTFDGGTLGDPIENDIPAFSSLRAVYSDDVTPLTGNRVARIDLNLGQEAGSGALFNITDLHKGGECWFQVPCWFPTGFSFGANVGGEGDQKFLRILTATPTNNSTGYDDIYIFRNDPTYGYYFRYEGNPVLPNTNFPFGTPADRPALNQWGQPQVYYKLDNVDSTGGGDATMRFWMGQDLLYEETRRVTISEAEGFMRQCHLMTFWNGGSPQAQTYYFDSMRYTTITPTNTDINGYPLLPNVGA
jgi:hypothetical protein